MWATYTARKDWFKAVVKDLEPLGLKIVPLKQTIIVTDAHLPGSKQGIINSEAAFIKFARARRVQVDIPKDTRIDAHRPSVRPLTPISPLYEQPVEAVRQAEEPPQSTAAKADEAVEARVERLVAVSLKAIEQRNIWERRATAAETQIATLSAIVSDLRNAAFADRKFDSLRRFLAREFHPDYATADAPGKAVKAEIFKRIWPVVEEIDRTA
jgi:hypothetical protein